MYLTVKRELVTHIYNMLDVDFDVGLINKIGSLFLYLNLHKANIDLKASERANTSV